MPDNSRSERLSNSEVQNALESVCASDVFEGATRLQEFLTHVVKVSLNEPEKKIPAKAIAQDVYKRDVALGGDSENVVRVDAGRLRRRLSEYYNGQGADDPVSIHIDAGGYTPRYEMREQTSPLGEEIPPFTRKKNVIGLAVLTLAILTFGFGVGAMVERKFFATNQPTQEADAESGDTRKISERQAVFEKSPSAFQAVGIAEQARDLIFPMFEREQVELALGMFRLSIKKDKDYSGGYAGASQVLAAMALFLPEGEMKQKLAAEALVMVERATSLAPANAWSQSALAWVLFLQGNNKEALRTSERAVALSSSDGNVLDFHALITMFNGNFEETKRAADPKRERSSANNRLANKSFYGVASYYLGQFDEAIASLEASIAAGDPISAPTLAFLSASHFAAGNKSEAARYARELSENWPKFRADIVLGRLFVDRRYSDKLQRELETAGWTTGD